MKNITELIEEFKHRARHILESNDAMNLIGGLFSSELPMFIVEEEINMGTYAYGYLYRYNDLSIEFGCEKGFFSHKILYKSHEYYLFHYDDKLKSLPMTGDNILYAFHTLCGFLREKFGVETES